MARLGILGGTFNPPHLAHLVCAREAREQLGLDRVVLMPVHRPPHKPLPDDPGPEHRVRMCELAAAGEERLEVSRLEVDRGGRSYTVDTLRVLHERSPGDHLTFVVGGDMARSLAEWRAPDEVLELAELAVFEREGAGRREIEPAVASVGAAGERVRYLEMPRMDVSSSQVRTRVAAGRSIRCLVPEPVADYIAEHGLYRSPEDGA